MAKYVKLGKKAECFYDAIAKLKVLKGNVLELTKKQQVSPKITRAIASGHLVLTDKGEFEKVNEVIKEDKSNDFEEMTKKELTKSYQDNYQVTEEEVNEFGKKNKSDMIKELEELDEE